MTSERAGRVTVWPDRSHDRGPHRAETFTPVHPALLAEADMISDDHASRPAAWIDGFRLAGSRPHITSDQSGHVFG